MKTRDIFKYALAALIIIGFFVLLIILVYVDVPDRNQELLYLVIGALIAAFSGIVSYFFGSSLGSQSKDEFLRKDCNHTR